MTLENTHPFQRGRWLFAHNGTIEDLPFLERRVSSARAAEVVGTTDSELLFAFVLTALDAGGDADTVLAECARELAGHGSIGSCNFLLSDGETMYAHRLGRPLFLLERSPGEPVRASRESIETGAVLETPWTSRRHALLVASERITDEPWVAVDEGTLLRLRRGASPTWMRL
jgi:glutamine amidotransferase